MADGRGSAPGARRRRRSRHIGVIDIGSNSIRLVVFDAVSRMPHPIFNEKVLCGLGRDLERTGVLNPHGVALAMDNLARFAGLVRAMDLRRVRVVGTAALRDAEDGPGFVAEARKRTGLAIDVVSGAEEARLSALGVVSGIPEADGMMGDLGGGSLEIVRIDRGRLREYETLPFGPLRLREAAEKGRGKIRELVDQHLDAIGWLPKTAGRRFYAVGGAWRAIARLHMAHAGYPLHVIHHYALKRGKAEEFLELVASLSRESLERLSNAPRKRLESLPLAALVLWRILRRVRPEELVFSATGLREGCLFDELTPSLRAQDPLLSACMAMAKVNARFPLDGRALLDWVTPVLKPKHAEARRLWLAACHLGDIAWGEHPDYRAEIAFLRVLRMPVTGLDHAGRAFLGLTVFTRYDGAADGDITRPAWFLLDEERLREAYLLGLALRLAYTLSGGTAAILRKVSLRLEGGAIKLAVRQRDRLLIGEAVERRLDALARAVGRPSAIKIAPR